MGVVRHQARIDGPRERVFEYVDGYQNVSEYMFGVTRFEPTTEQTSGLGATFAVTIDVGPKALKSIVKCTEYVENELIALEAIEGFGANTRWRFADADGGSGTDLDVEFSYTLPGGMAGKLLGKIIGPFAAQAVRHTEVTIGKKVGATG
ncbi:MULTISPECIES: SRPBCC family protein [Gordonia]|uniref:SRPBCC family protein n=2 Tax=Gordonia terrae TaxID=2055 RepID=A0A2I1R8A2_9ACTN|nr:MULTISPECIES: SRPBCC family protein [Gordonia]ANY22607.1 polyketide cyclase [Gordonia terrae]AWO83345.1 SRPBCC family protein [Gordonia terrae]MCG7634224.1 SRPBCC family protein [Gordonia sp. McavH-238-E]PKZ65373.1 SRPBCC family protein [Gordonia terrae]UPW10528.1 SRPBCC family protein [Gordonia terrae]